MGRLQFARLAEHDLEEIADYIARDSRHAALSFVGRLRAACHRLADHPEMGTSRLRFKGGNLRSFSVGQYLIFYRKSADGIEVARVLHGARDLDALLD
ncbi:MAG TPA: type II toxin-antitoxin system RelE/ParE family toxin [Phycisphaerae bacterium]|nr:type II toxin-antitoxin system RelE/ParE family toxin [Phycisphaerae bacterium]